MFHVGQKVVCVDDCWGTEDSRWCRMTPNRPVLRCVYTIRLVEMFPDGMAGFLLCELRNPEGAFYEGFSEPQFGARRFRPVKTTNIEIFTAMLAPQPKEPANA